MRNVLLIALALLLCGGAYSQTTAVPMTVTFQNADVADIYIWVHRQWADPATGLTLAADVAVGDTSINLVNSAGLPASGGLMLDAEMVTYSGLSGNAVTGVVRGQQQTTAAAHSAATASVHNLAIVTPTAFVRFCVARQIAVIRQTLGASGSAVGAAIASAATAQATAQATPTVQ